MSKNKGEFRSGLPETAGRSFALYVSKKLIRIALLVFAVSIVTFALMEASPIDPLSANVGQAALGTMSTEQISKLESYWGTDVNPVERYMNWATSFVRGDMGVSLLYRQPVSSVIWERLSNSLILLAAAWLISGILGLFLGVISAVKRGRLADRIIRGYCIVISSTPSFWIAMLLLLIFGVYLGIFPVGFSAPVGQGAEDASFIDQLRHAFLPALALSITGISGVCLHTREKVIDICESDYVTFARCRGESGFDIFRNHILRNALLPAVTMQLSGIGEIFGGSVLVEQVFSYAGIGQAAVTAGLGSDMPLLMGITVIMSVIVFAGNFTADLLYMLIDPRMRKGGLSGGK